MSEIFLSNLELKTFTEQNAEDYCLLNSINSDKIIVLDLSYNKLTDISGVKLFKNLEFLSIENNKITDISVLKYLNNLKELIIRYLELESDQIQYINSLKNLEKLWCYKGFKNFKQINKNIRIIK